MDECKCRQHAEERSRSKARCHSAQMYLREKVSWQWRVEQPQTRLRRMAKGNEQDSCCAGIRLTTYLSRTELAALTGSPLRRRQVAWLAREGWPHVVAWDGWPRVAREYHDKRMLGVRGERERTGAEPDMANV